MGSFNVGQALHSRAEEEVGACGREGGASLMPWWGCIGCAKHWLSSRSRRVLWRQARAKHAGPQDRVWKVGGGVEIRIWLRCHFIENSTPIIWASSATMWVSSICWCPHHAICKSGPAVCAHDMTWTVDRRWLLWIQCVGNQDNGKKKGLINRPHMHVRWLVDPSFCAPLTKQKTRQSRFLFGTKQKSKYQSGQT